MWETGCTSRYVELVCRSTRGRIITVPRKDKNREFRRRKSTPLKSETSTENNGIMIRGRTGKGLRCLPGSSRPKLKLWPNDGPETVNIGSEVNDLVTDVTTPFSTVVGTLLT